MDSVAFFDELVSLYEHLGSRKNDYVNAKQAVNRVIYILQTIFAMKNPGMVLQASDAIPWFECMIERNYLLIPEFCQHLENAPLLSKPATIVGYMDSLSSAIKWLTFYYKDDGSSGGDHIRRLTANQISGALEVLNRERKKYRAQIKLRPFKTREKQVSNRNLPPGGLKDLQEKAMEEIKVLLSIDWSKEVVTDKNFKWFVRVLVSGLYVLNVQGRIGGLVHLSLTAGEEIVANGRSHSFLFKTQSAYGTQPVCAASPIRAMLEIYIRYLFPWAKAKDPEASWVKEKNGDYVQRLLLTACGMANTNLGREVTAFFAIYNLHTTTTMIRSLIESDSYALYRNGAITSSEKHSLNMINGHSSQMSQDRYVYDQREEDAKAVERVVESQLTHTDLSFTSSTPLVGFVTESPELVNGADPWGNSRADFNTHGLKKAKWTAEEMEFIGQFCSNELQKYADAPAQLAIAEQNIVSTCLAYIKGQGKPRALPIFHFLHVARSERLKNGYVATQKLPAYAHLPAK